MTRSGCRARRYGDEMQCGPCGLTWGVNDDAPPPCAPDDPKAAGREALRELHRIVEGRRDDVACHACGHRYPEHLGRYGCPDCGGEGAP